MVFSMVYTTKELIDILAAERRACLNGHRLNLAVKVSGVNPLIDQFIKTDGIQKFAAYQDFKLMVHRYQREHQVSGIVWRQLTVQGQTFCYPVTDDNLIALESDLAILKTAKNRAIAFWQEVTASMDLYLSINHGKDYQAIAPPDVDRMVQRTEWAQIVQHSNSQFLEIILQLGWGQPQEAAYKWGWPKSGSEYVHAVNPGSSPIC
jgi:hypothetical protein